MTGSVKLVELKVRDVDFALGQLAKRLSTYGILASSALPCGTP
jgi:hypothetical protein